MSVSAEPSGAIRRRLLLSGAVIVVVTVLGCVAAIAIATSAIGSLDADMTQMLLVDEGSEHLQHAITKQETLALDFALARDPGTIEAIRQAEADELHAYEHLEGTAVHPAIAAAGDTVREAAASWRTGWLNPYLDAIEAGRPADGSGADAAQFHDPLAAALEELTLAVEAEQAAIMERSRTAGMAVASVLAPVGIGAAALVVVVWWWVTRTVSEPLGRLNRRAREVLAGADVAFVAERDDEIGELAASLERMRREASDRYRQARLEADRAAIFNQLAELISFAQDETELVSAAIRTLGRLVPTPRGEVLLVNNSTNRLLVAGCWGDRTPDGGPVAVDRVDRCPGIRRGTAFVAHDLADDMAVHCPAHPAETGTVACVPMPALGTIVGVMHLEHPTPSAFDPETVAVVARVAEQVALAIANARLMETMEGLAMTDPLTGLRNPRFFDGFLEQELAGAARDHEPTTVLMLDVDHFKRFNDTHGHPAGDEALRTFARVLRSSVRSSDVIARYGGEEFVIALHRTGIEDGRLLAEKLRETVEQAVVEIGPGRYARITVSIGVATSEAGRTDAKGLLALADAALYRAKEAGRNRVELAPTSPADVEAAARRRVRPDGDEPEAAEPAGAEPIHHLRGSRRRAAPAQRAG